MSFGVQPDRRQFVRVPFDGEVRAEPLVQASSSRMLHLLPEDLSEGGARLSCPDSSSPVNRPPDWPLANEIAASGAIVRL
jgi:hypothetical protein